MSMELFTQQPADPAADLSSCQKTALEALSGIENVFLTGVAGSGKSFLIRRFLHGRSSDAYPVLASTGAAAILVGGRTFHSFFGLGIMQGGFDATVERALGNKRLVKRLKQTLGVVIDEVSMLSGATIRAAEQIARMAREKTTPWGGLKVVTVGDFAQLPPVTLHQQARDWAFLDESWERSQFRPAMLRTIMRTQDPEFLAVLNFVRQGVVNRDVALFLEERTRLPEHEFDGTRLFPHRETTERYNLERLERIPGETREVATEYWGSEKHIEDLKRQAPVPEVIRLKEGALVMLRQNDPQGRWVNGSLGHIYRMQDEFLTIEMHSGSVIEVAKTDFTLLDAEGKEVASARNFPVNLAYASTIHKAQGMTLDQVMVDLRNLWEPGQAYVALSRVKTAEGLFLSGWNPGSIKTDPAVQKFYRELD